MGEHWMITFREEQREYGPTVVTYRTAAIAEHPMDWLARFETNVPVIIFAMPIDAAIYEKHQNREEVSGDEREG